MKEERRIREIEEMDVIERSEQEVKKRRTATAGVERN